MKKLFIILFGFVASVFFSACEIQHVVSADETFVLVATRSSSDVAMTAPPMASSVPVDAKLSIGESLTWIDGTTYLNWEVTSLRARPLGMGDPIFADIYYQMGDRSALEALRYISDKDAIGIAYKVDSQVRLIAAPGGSPIYVLQRPLSQTDAMALEAELKDMKFDPGPVDGVIDAETRRALGFYLEYRGHLYRPMNPVISTAFFYELVGRLPEYALFNH
jgi:hypothetical protein